MDQALLLFADKRSYSVLQTLHRFKGQRLGFLGSCFIATGKREIDVELDFVFHYVKEIGANAISAIANPGNRVRFHLIKGSSRIYGRLKAAFGGIIRVNRN